MPLSPAHSGAAGTPGVVLRLEGPGASESEPRMLLKTQGVGKITCESGFGLKAMRAAASCGLSSFTFARPQRGEEFPSWVKKGVGVVQDSSPFIRSSAMSRGRIQDDRQKSSA